MKGVGRGNILKQKKNIYNNNYNIYLICSNSPASLSYHFEKSAAANQQKQHHNINICNSHHPHHHSQNQPQHSLQLTFQNLNVLHNERQILSDVSGFVR